MPTSVSSAVVPALTTNALTVLKKRYLKKSLQGEPLEAPADMFRRVATVIAGAEALFNPAADTEPLAETFYRLMTNLEFLPNSPTLMNAGRELGQLSACFVLPVGDSIDDIFDAVKFTALIHKCLVGDTLVMSNGLTRLNEVEDGGLVMTDEGPFPVSALHDNGEQPVFEVRTNRGYTITGTAEHRLLVVAPGGSHEWRKIGEIGEGDWLVMKPGAWLGGETKLPEFTFEQKPGRNRTSFKSREYLLPRELTPELAEFIGLYIGDGSNHRDGIRFTVGGDSPEVLERIKGLSLALFGKVPSVTADPAKKVFEVAILSTQIKEWFAFLGFTKTLSREAHVPDVILRGSEEVAAAFIRGLFTADGCVRRNGHITFATASRRLGEEVQIMLLALGVPTHRRRDVSDAHYESWQVSICTKAGFRRFREKIGFGAAKKAERLAAVDEDAIFVRGETIPNQRGRLRAWYDALPAGSRREARHQFDDLLNRVTAPRELSRQRLTAAMTKTAPFPAFFEELAAEELFFVRVTEIGFAGIRPVYDLTVPRKHAYVANGFVAHNSGGGTGFSFSRLRPANDVVMSTTGISSGPISFMRVFDLATETIKQGGTRRGANMGILRVDHPDILDFIRSKSDLKCFNNFNISVGLTEAFMRAVEDDGEYELINPRSRAVVARLKAREVFRSIVHQAWATGEPGIVFLDRLNRDNPTPQVGEIESTNPCVTADTFVQTTDGPRQVRDLVGRPFVAVVGGVPYPSGAQGFFPTGTKPVLRLRTREGHSLRLTGDHPVRRAASVTRARVVEEWVPAAQLAPGDRIVLNRHENLCWAGRYSEAEGYLVGLLVGDGTLKADKAVISAWPVRKVVNGDTTPDGIAGVMRAAAAYAETLPHRSDFAGWTEVAGRGEQRLALAEVKRVAESLGMAPGAKTITPALEQCSSDFCRAFLRGLFDADGSVQGTTAKGVSVRLAQSDLATLEAVQRMLLRLGVASTISSIPPSGKGGQGGFDHVLAIAPESIPTFAARIGFHDTAKSARLTSLLGGYRRTLNRERFLATVASLEADGTEAVYDVQVPGANAFDANGLFVHNCGEQPLLPYESCNLGSINLGRLVREGRVDWARLGEVVRLAVRFLDNVIEVNNYPLPKIDEMTRSNRKIGLGVMGWADMLISLGVAYDSPEAVALADQVMRAIREEGHAASRQLARERGAFPNYKGSIYDRPGAEPMRNATVTTIAPTGTISIIANSSSGIEPLFAVSYIRTVLDKDRLIEVNPAFERLARERGFYSVELMERIAEAGTVRGMEGVPDDVQRVFATAHDITPEVHIRMQAAFQKHTDNAVSKTVNFPAEAAEGDVDKVFRLAYELDCKGVTIYRDGSREDQVLSTAKKHEAPTLPGVIAAPEAPRAPAIRNRPRALRGATYQMDTGCGPLYVTINEDEEGIFELFTTMGKAGGCASSQCEAIGRMVSLAWRSGVEAGPVIKQLVGISCHQPAGFGVEKVLSCADAVAKAIERHCGEGGGVKKRALDRGACPDCGGTVEHLEGCVVCRGCGYSECA